MAGAAARAGAQLRQEPLCRAGWLGLAPADEPPCARAGNQGHEAGVKAPMLIRYQVPRGKGRGQLLRTPDL